eukprot:445240_1
MMTNNPNSSYISRSNGNNIYDDLIALGFPHFISKQATKLYPHSLDYIHKNANNEIKCDAGNDMIAIQKQLTSMGFAVDVIQQSFHEYYSKYGYSNKCIMQLITDIIFELNNDTEVTEVTEEKKHNATQIRVLKNQFVADVIVESEDDEDDTITNSDNFKNKQKQRIIENGGNVLLIQEIHADMTQDIIKEGFVFKQRKYMKEWRVRYLVITSNSLQTFALGKNQYKQTDKIMFDLTKLNIIKRINEKEFAIIGGYFTSYHFRVSSTTERAKWCNLLTSKYCVYDEAEIESFRLLMNKQMYGKHNIVEFTQMYKQCIPHSTYIIKFFDELLKKQKYEHLKILCDELVGNTYINASDSAICYCILGDIINKLLPMSDIVQQIDYYKTACDFDSNNFKYPLKVARILMNNYEYKEALVYFNNSLSLLKANGNVHNWNQNDVQCYVKCLIELKQYDKALVESDYFLNRSVISVFQYHSFASIIWSGYNANDINKCLCSYEKIMSLFCNNHQKLDHNSNQCFTDAVTNYYHLQKIKPAILMKTYENLLVLKPTNKLLLKYYGLSLELMRKTLANSCMLKQQDVEFIMNHWRTECKFDGFDTLSFNVKNYSKLIHSYGFGFLDQLNKNNIICQGWLLKSNKYTHVYQTVYAILSNNKLSMFNNDLFKDNNNCKLYEIDLDEKQQSTSVISRSLPDSSSKLKFSFNINSTHHYFQAPNLEERHKWVYILTSKYCSLNTSEIKSFDEYMRKIYLHFYPFSLNQSVKVLYGSHLQPAILQPATVFSLQHNNIEVYYLHLQISESINATEWKKRIHTLNTPPLTNISDNKNILDCALQIPPTVQNILNWVRLLLNCLELHVQFTIDDQERISTELLDILHALLLSIVHIENYSYIDDKDKKYIQKAHFFYGLISEKNTLGQQLYHFEKASENEECRQICERKMAFILFKQRNYKKAYILFEKETKQNWTQNLSQSQFSDYCQCLILNEKADKALFEVEQYYQNKDKGLLYYQTLKLIWKISSNIEKCAEACESILDICFDDNSDKKFTNKKGAFHVAVITYFVLVDKNRDMLNRFCVKCESLLQLKQTQYEWQLSLVSFYEMGLLLAHETDKLISFYKNYTSKLSNFQLQDTLPAWFNYYLKDLSQFNDLTEFKQQFEKIATMYPNNDLIQCKYGCILYSLKLYEDAKVYWKKTMELKPSVNCYKAIYANILLDNKEYDKVIEFVGNAIHKSSNKQINMEYHEIIGLAYVYTNKYKLAIEHAEKVLAADKYSMFLPLLIQRNAFDETKILIDFYLDKHPYNPCIHSQAAQFYSIIGNNEKSQQYYKNALMYGPNEVHIVIDYLFSLIHANKLIDAELYCKKLINKFPNNTKVIMNVGFVYVKMNDYDKAHHYYKKVRSIDPNSDGINAYYGYLCYVQKSYDESIKYIQKELENVGSSYEWITRCYYGMSLRQLNQYQESKIQFEKSIDINNKNALSQFEYGMLLEQSFSKVDESIPHFKAAYELEPMNETYSKKWKQIQLKI